MPKRAGLPHVPRVQITRVGVTPAPPQPCHRGGAVWTVETRVAGVQCRAPLPIAVCLRLRAPRVFSLWARWWDHARTGRCPSRSWRNDGQDPLGGGHRQAGRGQQRSMPAMGTARVPGDYGRGHGRATSDSPTRVGPPPAAGGGAGRTPGAASDRRGGVVTGTFCRSAGGGWSVGGWFRRPIGGRRSGPERERFEGGRV